MSKLPDLSRFELQCLRKISDRGEATARDVHTDLDDPPTYSTVRKIIERLEDKGAVKRLRRDGKAWVYAASVSTVAIVHKEIRRFLDVAFDGAAASLVSQLADMQALSLDDLKAIEERLDRPAAQPASRRRS